MLIVAYFQLKSAPLILWRIWKDAFSDFFNIFAQVKRALRTVLDLVGDPFTLYYSFYGITAVLGTLFNPFFFAFHLVEVIIKYPILVNVLESVINSYKPLLLTYLLLFLLNYLFTLMGYFFLRDHYLGFCKTTFSCLMTQLDKSQKVDGGIGGFMEDPHGEGHIDALRLFFDQGYNIFMMIILINIVSGTPPAPFPIARTSYHLRYHN